MKNIKEARDDLMHHMQGMMPEMDEESVYPRELLMAVGVPEDVAQGCAEAIEDMDDRATLLVLKNILAGNQEEAGFATKNAMLLSMCLGYMLGCAHTAERVGE